MGDVVKGEGGARTSKVVLARVEDLVGHARQLCRVDDADDDTVDGDDFTEDDAEGVLVLEGLRGHAAHLMRFLVLILGARTPPPRMDAPVTKIPLQSPFASASRPHNTFQSTHHPAPSTLKPIQRPMPVAAHA